MLCKIYFFDGTIKLFSSKCSEIGLISMESIADDKYRKMSVEELEKVREQHAQVADPVISAATAILSDPYFEWLHNESTMILILLHGIFDMLSLDHINYNRNCN